MSSKTSDTNRGFTELVVIRHGLTEANAEGILQGHFDSPLVEAGIRQAHSLAVRLSRERFAAIYSSDLCRAKDTAAIIAAPHGLTVIHEPSWREWHLGRLENTSYEEARRSYPQIMEAFKYDADDIAIPDGESKTEFYVRIGTAMENLAVLHPGHRILVVTHGGVLQAILKHALGSANTWRFLPRSSNTSYNRFVYRDGAWQLCCWNDTSHLDEETADQ